MKRLLLAILFFAVPALAQQGSVSFAVGPGAGVGGTIPSITGDFNRTVVTLTTGASGTAVGTTATGTSLLYTLTFTPTGASSLPQLLGCHESPESASAVNVGILAAPPVNNANGTVTVKWYYIGAAALPINTTFLIYSSCS